MPSTFAAQWRDAVEAHPTSAFLVFEDVDGRVDEWTYAEFDGIVDRVAVRLRDAGIGPGDGVHLALRNSPGFIALWLAAARFGAFIVPADPAAAAREIHQQIRRTGAKLGICANARSEVYRDGAAEAGIEVIAVSETSADIAEDGVLLGTGPMQDSAEPGIEDRLAIMFTSGTTSQPKGVVLTQANYAHVARAMAANADLGSDDRWLVVLPLFHANAQFYCFAPAIAVGASVALTATFSASRWAASARALGATHASLFAAPIRMILARTPDDAASAGLRHVWYAQNLGEDHHAAFARLAGVRPRQLYGLTESTEIVTYDRAAVARHDSIGQPVPDREVRLIDRNSHEEVEAGSIGMIAVAGERGRDLFVGYLDDPTTTARAFFTDDHGVDWFLTGDLARETPEGHWEFVGRADDVIKVSGENVSLSEVEAVLAQAPGVLEVAVVGQADPIRDRVPVAFIVAKDPEKMPSLEDLETFAQENLAPCARPRAWHALPSLPRTSVGKIRRFRMDPQETGGALTLPTRTTEAQPS